MKSLHRAALSAYTALSAPYRRARIEYLVSRSLCPISVLFYHRVADFHPNDWTITKQGFQQHIDYCQENFDVIDLAEVQRRLREHQSSAPAVSLTFDDGYSDNCDFALPMLIQRGLSCTYFVTTHHILHQRPFSHDVDYGQTLATNTPKQLREMSDAGIEIGCHTRSHPDFKKIYDPQLVRREIIDAKKELEQIIGKAVRYFAFPFGLPAQLTQVAIEAVHEAGFDGFCSAFGGYNLIGRDSFHIRRCHGDPEFSRLKNWLTFDPRKSGKEPSVRYFLPPGGSFDPGCTGMPRISSPH
jgi:peptidoglycan/xylan/chitin deacetylase (PgdA/CDA1 family)